jgi:PAS domain S-box-containing protein
VKEEEKGKSVGRAATTSEMAQKHNLFRNLLNNIPDSIYFKDKEHRFIAVSKAKAEHHGVDPEDFVGKTDFDFYPKEQAKKMQEDDDYVLKTKEPIIGKEEKVIRPDGTARWYSVTKIPYRDEEGNIIGSIGISRDITELKQAENKLRGSEKRYHDLIESTPVGILGIDENGTIIYENLTMRKILGIPEGEFDESLGTKLAELLNVIATGYADKVRELLKGNPVSGIVTPFVSVYGRRSILLVDGLPIKDSEGRITGGLLMIQDITERKRAEEALREGERFLANIFASIQDGITVLDKDMNIVRVNPTIERWNADAMPLVGKKCYAAFHGRSERCEVCPTWRTLQTGEAAHEVIPQYSPEGKIDKWLDISSFPVIDKTTGETSGVIEYVRDITERKQAEEALHESEQRYKALFESALDGVFVIDAETMRVVLANKAAANTFGFDSAEDAIGIDPLAFVFPDDRNRVIRIIVEDMFVKDLRQVNEFRTITRDGREIWIRAIGARIEYQGRLAGLVSLCDITERKRAEEAIKESEEKFRTLAEQSPNMIFINKGGRVVYANKRCEEVTGYTRDEFYSADFNFLDLIAPKYREFVKTSFGRHMRGEEIERYEYAILTKDGRRVEAINATKLIDYEEGKAILGISTDITQYKKAERERIAAEKTATKLKALDRMKDEFLSMTSHELKTPLTSVSSFLQLMKSGKFGKITRKQEEALTTISTGIERLGGSIDKLLRISKLELGEMKFEMKNLQLADFIQNTVKKMKSLAKQKRITLTQKVSELPVVRADREQLTEVLTNLVDNAIKFTPEGGKVTVEAKREKDRILVMVKDTGIGIAKKNMPKLFTKFFQVNHLVPGTGLGLSICKKIILGHGGRIWAKSTLGRGSTFFFALPIKK